MSQSEPAEAAGDAPAGRDLIEQIRAADRAADAPLNVESRQVISNGGTPYVNLTNYGVRTLGITAGEQVRVATFRDALVVYREGALE